MLYRTNPIEHFLIVLASRIQFGPKDVNARHRDRVETRDKLLQLIAASNELSFESSSTFQ